MIKKYLLISVIVLIIIFLIFLILDFSTRKSCDCFILVSQTNFLTQEMADSAYQQCLDNMGIKINPDCCFNKNRNGKANNIEKSFCIFKGFFKF